MQPLPREIVQKQHNLQLRNMYILSKWGNYQTASSVHITQWSS